MKPELQYVDWTLPSQVEERWIVHAGRWLLVKGKVLEDKVVFLIPGYHPTWVSRDDWDSFIDPRSPFVQGSHLREHPHMLRQDIPDEPYLMLTVSDHPEGSLVDFIIGFCAHWITSEQLTKAQEETLSMLSSLCVFGWLNMREVAHSPFANGECRKALVDTVGFLRNSLILANVDAMVDTIPAAGVQRLLRAVLDLLKYLRRPIQEAYVVAKQE